MTDQDSLQVPIMGQMTDQVPFELPEVREKPQGQSRPESCESTGSFLEVSFIITHLGGKYFFTTFYLFMN